MKNLLQKHETVSVGKDRFSLGVSAKNWGLNTNIEALNDVSLTKGITREERDVLLRRLSDDNESHEGQRS
mgnify:CR=1 FL=1